MQMICRFGLAPTMQVPCDIVSLPSGTSHDMKLQIERPYIEALAEAFPDLETLKQQLMFGDKVEVQFQELGNAEVDMLLDLYGKAGPKMQAQHAQLATLQRVFDKSAKRYAADELRKSAAGHRRISGQGRNTRLDVHAQRRRPALALCRSRLDLHARQE